MKTLLMITLLTVGTLTVATAQTEKGSYLAGVQVGNLFFPTSNQTGSSSGPIIALQPTVGLFLTDGLVVGAGVPFYYIGSGSSTGISISQIGVTPFARYYAGKSTIKPFVGVSAGFLRTSVSFTGIPGSNRGDQSENSFVYGASGGVAFFLNRSVGFEASLNYSDTNQGSGASILNNTNGLIAFAPKYVTIGLGFQVFFGKKESKVQK